MNAAFPVGARVALAALDDVTGFIPGTVVEPTVAELAYAETYAAWVPPGSVVVRFDGDEDWERGWERPGDLRVLP